MRPSNRVLSSVYATLLLVSPLVSGAFAADEFVPPPPAEREAVAAVARQGGKVEVDGEYRITTVQLGTNSINDDLKLLVSCERLTSLQISSPKITDAGIEHLKGLTRLTTIRIFTSGMTAEGIASLGKALPNCRVTSFGNRGGFGAAGGGPAAPAGRAGNGGRAPGGGFDATMLGANGFGFRPSRTTLARDAAVQDDLKLTPEQRQKIAVAAEASSPAALARALDEKITAALNPEQLIRLKQIELQQVGILGLLREDVAKELSLTDDQKTSIGKFRDEASVGLRTAMSDLTAQRAPGVPATDLMAKLREKSAELNKQRDEKILAVLTNEQRNAWLTMLGPKGPEVSTTSDRFSSFTSRTPAESAKALFDRYDTDKSGTLTDAEFPETNRTRRSMTSSGVTLKLPISREDFEKIYAKYLEGARGGR